MKFRSIIHMGKTNYEPAIHRMGTSKKFVKTILFFFFKGRNYSGNTEISQKLQICSVIIVFILCDGHVSIGLCIYYIS